jgi:WD40 repeat protein
MWKVELVRQIPLCEEKLRDLALSPTGDRVAVACGDGTIRELEPTLLNETMRMELHQGGASCVCYHPTKPVLISGGKDGQLRFWHTHEGGRQIHAIPAHKGSIYTATINPTGNWLATVGRDSLLKVWDANTLDPVFRTERDQNGHTHSVNSAIWLGNSLFTSSDDRNIKEFKLDPGSN